MAWFGVDLRLLSVLGIVGVPNLQFEVVASISV